LQLDIEVVLSVVEALVREIPDEEANSEATSLCIKNIERVIVKIQEQLLEIHSETAYHKTKYFNGYRTLNLEKNLVQLRAQKKILDQRIDLLMKVLAVHK
jgi:hypothetical protein